MLSWPRAAILLISLTFLFGWVRSPSPSLQTSTANLNLIHFLIEHTLNLTLIPQQVNPPYVHQNLSSEASSSFFQHNTLHPILIPHTPPSEFTSHSNLYAEVSSSWLLQSGLLSSGGKTLFIFCSSAYCTKKKRICVLSKWVSCQINKPSSSLSNYIHLIVVHPSCTS